MKVLSSCKVKRDIQKELIQNYPSVSFQFCKHIGEAKDYLSEVEILITYGEDLTDELIDQAKELKWIMVISAGMDQMPFAKLAEREILITNCKGIHKTPMAEYVFASLLQVSREVKQLIENEKAHQWDRTIKMTEISGRTMLIAGTGAIGQEVARLAKAFQMKTIGISKSGSKKDFFDEVTQTERMGELLPQADFIISVLPSTLETKEMFTSQHFELMKETALFLNMGRGDVVSEGVLLEALKTKQIRHAILDVFKEEPLPKNHPLWDLENVTVTPHLSGISPEYQPRAFEIFKLNLTEYLNGGNGFKNVINPNRGY